MLLRYHVMGTWCFGVLLVVDVFGSGVLGKYVVPVSMPVVFSARLLEAEFCLLAATDASDDVLSFVASYFCFFVAGCSSLVPIVASYDTFFVGSGWLMEPISGSRAWFVVLVLLLVVFSFGLVIMALPCGSWILLSTKVLFYVEFSSVVMDTNWCFGFIAWLSGVTGAFVAGLDITVCSCAGLLLSSSALFHSVSIASVLHIKHDVWHHGWFEIRCSSYIHLASWPAHQLV
ncbi:hypothetical protein QVD17_38124 [Tagetes erecta]|uniref:Transmembrane protein n=1 Tax=Tagetes erecta TaxID=13708 RepID=A0AAD8NJ52_TARER|nr:hypothetical protein QVD17_38124 [Tagetes erecta]